METDVAVSFLVRDDDGCRIGKAFEQYIKDKGLRHVDLVLAPALWAKTNTLRFHEWFAREFPGCSVEHHGKYARDDGELRNVWQFTFPDAETMIQWRLTWL